MQQKFSKMLRKLDPKQSYDWISVINFCASNWDLWSPFSSNYSLYYVCLDGNMIIQFN